MNIFKLLVLLMAVSYSMGVPEGLNRKARTERQAAAVAAFENAAQQLMIKAGMADLADVKQTDTNKVAVAPASEAKERVVKEAAEKETIDKDAAEKEPAEKDASEINASDKEAVDKENTAKETAELKHAKDEHKEEGLKVEPLKSLREQLEGYINKTKINVTPVKMNTEEALQEENAILNVVKRHLMTGSPLLTPEQTKETVKDQDQYGKQEEQVINNQESQEELANKDQPYLWERSFKENENKMEDQDYQRQHEEAFGEQEDLKQQEQVRQEQEYQKQQVQARQEQEYQMQQAIKAQEYQNQIQALKERQYQREQAHSALMNNIMKLRESVYGKIHAMNEQGQADADGDDYRLHYGERSANDKRIYNNGNWLQNHHNVRASKMSKNGNAANNKVKLVRVHNSNNNNNNDKKLHMAINENGEDNFNNVGKEEGKLDLQHAVTENPRYVQKELELQLGRLSPVDRMVKIANMMLYKIGGDHSVRVNDDADNSNNNGFYYSRAPLIQPLTVAQNNNMMSDAFFGDALDTFISPVADAAYDMPQCPLHDNENDIKVDDDDKNLVRICSCRIYKKNP